MKECQDLIDRLWHAGTSTHSNDTEPSVTNCGTKARVVAQQITLVLATCTCMAAEISTMPPHLAFKHQPQAQKQQIL